MRLHFRQFILCGYLALGISAAAQAHTSIDQIVAFGDSLSDSGNLYRYTQVINANHPSFSPIPGAPYWKGHFSDGPIWVEELLKRLKRDRRSITLDDYAIGGASVQNDKISPLEILWPRHTSHDEIFAYLNTKGESTSSNNQHLYAMWMGANDYINLINNPTGPFDPEVETTTVVNMIQNDVKGLIQDVNAKKFIILNLPDLGRTPGAMILGDEASTALSQLTKLHNQKLQLAIDQLNIEYPDVTIATVDIFGAMNSLIDTNTWRGETVADVTFPCYGGAMSSTNAKAKMKAASHSKKFSVMLNANRMGDEMKACDNPNDHLFWDWIHPSTRIHRMIADQAVFELAARGL